MKRDPGSYRDPSGHVYHHDDVIYRAILPAGETAWKAIKDNPVISRLVREGKLIGFDLVERRDWPSFEEKIEPVALLRHPRLRVISYPYEWPFEALKDAALLHLELHDLLLENGLNLSDASAYNIQYVGASPIFIDLLSIRPYRKGEYWLGHDQFLRQFLNPLLLEAYTGVGFAASYRGDLEGIPTNDLARLLPLRARLKPSLQFSVFLPAKLSSRSASLDRGAKASREKGRPLPLSAFRQILSQVRGLVTRLAPQRDKTIWSQYGTTTSYTEGGQQAKEAFVREYVEKTQPELLIDVGCNDGSYSEMAFEAGAQSIIGLEMDRAALDYAYLRAKEKGHAFYAVCVDLANPSPWQGWRGRERRSLARRLQEARADGLLALAVTHHLIIGRNLPLQEVVEELVSYASSGIIEFVPKSDPMVRIMLQNRDDIFMDYHEQAFRNALLRHARILAEHHVAESDRILFWYERKK